MAQTATRLVRAPRSAVYAALVDLRALETWRVPDDMTAHVEQLDARVGGRFRVSLTYRGEGCQERPAGADRGQPDVNAMDNPRGGPDREERPATIRREFPAPAVRYKLCRQPSR